MCFCFKQHQIFGVIILIILISFLRLLVSFIPTYYFIVTKFGFTDGKTPLKPCKFRKKTENMVKRWVHIVGF